ncbi:MAG: hypothetical protein EA391_13230 [Balneolaceae bacterium]|nr:MAG: hypothetical protein EA391_13230 [Balneolaceae bacterium]
MMKNVGLKITEDIDEPTIDDDNLLLTQAMYDELKWMNFGFMKAELARQVWGSEYFFPVVNDYMNETLTEAMKLWETAENLEMLVQTPTGSVIQR